MKQRLHAEDWRNGGFGLYLHWPFCAAKCPYCDFNSHVAASIDQGRWQKAYLAEIDRLAIETPGRVLNSVFFGGGTPSLMEPDLVAAILDRIQDRWVFANDIEITLEANPGSVEVGRFRAYSQAGVNRISMGIQALNDADLRRLGRIHSLAEAHIAFDTARACFDRISFDLIYARQHQSLADWRNELCEALSMATDHLSLYQLTIEEGTVFGRRALAGRLPGLPDDATAAAFYDLTQDLCDAAGMPAYEVSNHARAGADSRHNAIYWRYGDYLGIGPGAHGRLTHDGARLATDTLRQPEAWLRAVETTGSGEMPRETLTASDQKTEMVLMGLRLDDGLSLSRIEALGAGPLSPQRIIEVDSLGLITTEGDRIKATRAGRKLLDSVIARLLEA